MRDKILFFRRDRDVERLLGRLGEIEATYGLVPDADPVKTYQRLRRLRNGTSGHRAPPALIAVR